MAWWGNHERNDTVNAALRLFMDRYPHITVIPEYNMHFSEYLDSLIANLTRGSEPDIFQSNYSWVHTIDGGRNPFLNLWDWAHIIDLSEWPDNILNRVVTTDGQLSGVVSGMHGRAIIYDTRIIQEHGLSQFPATFDEWIALGEAVAGNNTATNSPGNRYAFWPSMPNNDLSTDIIIMTMLYNHFGVGFQSDGKILPTIEQVQYIFNILQRMIDSGLLPTAQQQQGFVSYWVCPVWEGGHGGSRFEWMSNIHIVGSEFMNNDHNTYVMDNLGVALLPAVAPGGSRLAIQRPTLVHAVGPNTAHPELSVYLLNWLYTDEEALAILHDAFGIPVSSTASQLFKQQGGLWGIQYEGFNLIMTNAGIMCAYFEDWRLRQYRLFIISDLRNERIDTREAARQWVNLQQQALTRW